MRIPGCHWMYIYRIPAGDDSSIRMSKRDGTMYIAMKVFTKAETSLGQTVSLETDTVAGITWIYWTKTAARKAHGRNIRLQTICLDDS